MSNGINVMTRGTDYIDFTIAGDSQSLYRYESFTGKMRKLFGIGNYGKAVRGKERARIEAVAKIVFDNNLPFAVIL